MDEVKEKMDNASLDIDIADIDFTDLDSTDSDEESVDKNNDQEIDRLAYAIRFGSLNSTQEAKYKSKLADLVITAMNFNEMNEEKEQNLRYNGEIFVKLFRKVLTELYGKKDQATGNIIPFMRLLCACWNRKKLGINNRYNREEEKNKRVNLRNILKEACAELEIKYITPTFNLLNRDNFISYLRKLGADKEYQDRAEKVFSNQSFKSMDSPENDADKDNMQLNSDDKLHASTSREEFNYFYSLIEKLYAEYNGTRLFRCAKCYMTIRVYFELGNDIPVELREFIDGDFIRYYNESSGGYREKSRDDSMFKELIAAYLGSQPETIRKNMKKITNSLFRIGSEMKIC